MSFTRELSGGDRSLAARLDGFVPAEVFDIHAHLVHPEHFAPNALALMEGVGPLGAAEHRAALQRYMPCTKVRGLYFGFPHPTADRPRINAWVGTEARSPSAGGSRSLLVVAPQDDPSAVATQLRRGEACGIKVYHCYAARPDTMQAALEEFAPEWMWEILDEVQGVLMVHLVRDRAIADPDNQESLRRLCRRYPRVRVVLAHVARCFNYRHARPALRTLADLDNVVVDTSAIGEAEAFRAALELLGPRRVLWGSDFPVSETRGRCVATGDRFFWLQPASLRPDKMPPTAVDLTLVGLESLLGLREACADAGLTTGDVEDIFRGNAERLLAPHLAVESKPAPADGPALWQRARKVISGGTGLLSKRAEMFDARGWPAYFARCSGCEVWDLAGRRYLDFAGGIGAVLLGYSDPDVNAAVRRRVSLGSYCTLVNPQEVELAEQLLALHPWAGKVRYARGGGEAMTMAVRIARAATGRSGVAFCGYHGWHDWYLAANLGESDALDGHLLPGLEPRGVPRELRGTAVPFRYNDPGSFDAALARLGNNLAAVVMEPMRSSEPVDGFVARVAERCRQAGAVFVVDEVTSGLRFGFPGAMGRLGVEPDVAVYAKAMGNGFPFAAVVGREPVMDAAAPSFISSSYWTDGIGPAAALAVLEKVQRLRASEVVWARGARLQASLRQLAGRHPGCQLSVGGMPAIPTFAFGLGAQAAAAKGLYVRQMHERGFLASTQCYVMLAHEDAQVAQFLAATDEVWGEIAALADSGRLVEAAGTAANQAGFARLA